MDRRSKLKPFLNHNHPKMLPDHDDSGRTVVWKRIQQFLEPLTGPSAWPVPAGLAVGAALLFGVSLMQPAARPDSSPRRDLKTSPVMRDETPSAPLRSSQTLLLPSRPVVAEELPREVAIPREKPVFRAAPEPEAPAAVSPEKRVTTTQALPRRTDGPRRPRIAIVIDDMGFDRANSARALRLPPQVTLAYLPFAPEVTAQVRRARLKGHPVILHLPMEAPEHDGKPGINVLSVGSSPTDLRRQLNDILGRFGGYTGVNNHMGSTFTQDRAKMDIVISELKKRGLFFLDSRTSGRSIGASAAADAGIAYAVRDVFLDHEPDPEKIRARIAETENIARATGQAIAIGHPRTATMKEIAPWLAGIRERGFDLVRLDTLLNRDDGKKLAQVRTGE
jgi:uncharacterized protein